MSQEQSVGPLVVGPFELGLTVVPPAPDPDLDEHCRVVVVFSLVVM